MQVPESLFHAFEGDFEKLITQFAIDEGLLESAADIRSPRFLARSIIPHIKKLSALFNRDQKDQDSSLDPYWKESSNPAHLRLAYFLYFMPSNVFRVASVWAELARLGFQWPRKTFRAVEFGAGPASGACGIAAGEHYAGVKLPKAGSWALIEQDQSSLDLGTKWANTYFNTLGFQDWQIRPFHRKLDPSKGFLPKAAPKFDLWLMSFFLNESTASPKELASILLRDWTHHLEENGIVIIVEPALKLQSRKLLEFRKELLLEKDRKKADWLRILLPCLGHQACGALANAEDWCHEEVTWWRPPYFKKIDQLAGLDRKSLPFSYLVLTKSKRSLEEILPALAPAPAASRYRLVSPTHPEGRELEYFLCGQGGKQRSRYRPSNDADPGSTLQRGDILLGAETRGDKNSSRTVRIKKIVGKD